MSDSFIAIKAAQLLVNQKIDFFDLDGPSLAKNNPFLHLEQNYDSLGKFLEG